MRQLAPQPKGVYTPRTRSDRCNGIYSKATPFSGIIYNMFAWLYGMQNEQKFSYVSWNITHFMAVIVLSFTKSRSPSGKSPPTWGASYSIPVRLIWTDPLSPVHRELRAPENSIWPRCSCSATPTSKRVALCYISCIEQHCLLRSSRLSGMNYFNTQRCSARLSSCCFTFIYRFNPSF